MSTYSFSGIGEAQLEELVRTMQARDILYEANGVLSLGQRGERLHGGRSFFELYAIFKAPRVMLVQHDKEDVGCVQASFVAMHDYSSGPLRFGLSGRVWEAGEMDWTKGLLQVHPAEPGCAPTWLGQPGTLSTKLCQTMLGVLLDPGEQEQSWLTRPAALELARLRESYSGVLEPGAAPLEERPDGVTWHTFAGGAVNRLMAAGLEQISRKKWVAGNLSLRCQDVTVGTAREVLSGLADLDWEKTAHSAAEGMARGRVGELQPCLSEDAERSLLAERLLDVEGTVTFLRSTH